MSENLNRRPGSFSKYDSMSIEELETVLRADAEAPDGQGSDVDEILYAMEVLANIRRNNGFAGKTAREAYESFQQHYLPSEEENIESVPEQKPRKIILFRRLASIAAALAIVVSLSVTTNAFGWWDLWNVVAKWAEEPFHFSSGQEVGEPTPDDKGVYCSLQGALSVNNRAFYFLPNWIPGGYALNDIKVTESPKQETYLAIYLHEENMLKISVKSFQEGRPEQIEMSEDLVEVYTVGGTDYYIFSNYNQNRAVWVVDSYECYISGTLSIEEIKLMIDSIGKG